MSRDESRGFTLLEVMIASALGVVVLGIGLVAGMQMQRRAVFEEQTMVAQVTGRAVKELLAGDVTRAGLGMGNAPITFSEGDNRFAIQVWDEPDMQVALAPVFTADPTFRLPPAGTPYADMRSDVLQLYWGDPRSLVVMAPCGGGSGPIREGNSSTFCTGDNPPTNLQPPAGQRTPAILVNPTGNVACHIQVTQVQQAADRINANPGNNNNAINTGPCSDQTSDIWKSDGWLVMRTVGAAYRVNWAGNIPTLEYLAPGTATWVAVSRDVEQMKIRQAVIDLAAPNAAYRWFPDAAAARPTIEACTLAAGALCQADSGPPGNAPASDTELRSLLRQRVRAVEISLVIRTRRSDQNLVKPNETEENFPLDGFKRRTFTFQVAPRNFVSAGLLPAGM
ncbi:prepilin-type N-terminal cleavage/methylation domain-containing protein [Myxococcus llanfairpwllgwyngyllgogerychwyrndrobwllllantysiliogogogochensis]|uniref:Prepilin-type N-terminal cleavage/methylation domain-containing protein n=1 Tax=Myxococcus llanfairpwllgwyngyllgogerychwyrndrobwllllantysiliogogogochensis TaxID=2590453 RepID=A0A540WZ52_9BACT|nr:prepilin-type N-terminal cleavage/methylation domain-containing protein [Myxococcus llanfairpwllgwyngyllgogerychwyrndrobwllllantysiliogogogochensis]TQF14253.1 prepilin-type N-terminal cleavage/methylation domain-containing protein [Myxococcus llanfairpwllgwyngyllgogerychwyrndrobwllllantysiliogogogochensis]